MIMLMEPIFRPHNREPRLASDLVELTDNRLVSAVFVNWPAVNEGARHSQKAL